MPRRCNARKDLAEGNELSTPDLGIANRPRRPIREYDQEVPKMILRQDHHKHAIRRRLPKVG
jgi:hypothetical protein